MQTVPLMRTPDRNLIFILACLFALAWFSNIGYRKLVKADEGRYAEIPREMVASGDWLTPRLNGFKYFEKPALQYWATAAAFTIFGQNEWAARLWTALTGFFGVLLVCYAGNRVFDSAPIAVRGPPGIQVGLTAAIVLGSSAIYAFTGHMLTLDMGVSFFMSAAVLAVVMAQRDDAEESDRRNWMLAGWAAMALAVLSKGLIGIVLPCAAVAGYILLQRDWRMLRRLHLLAGGALFLAIAAPWFIAVSLANDEFFRFFFIHEHFERFLTKGHGRYQPAWYFIPVIAIGATPWLPAFLAGYWNAWKAAPDKRFQATRLLAIWCAVVFVFFSASGSKLGSYILPLFPAAALLTALQLIKASRAGQIAQALLAAALGIAVWVSASQLTRFAEPVLPAELLALYIPWVAASGATLAIAGGAAALLAWTARPLYSIAVLAVGGLGFTQLAITGHETLSPLYSAYHIAEKIKPRLKLDTPVYTVNTFDHTLPFYLGRTVTMVGYKDELAIAISWQPDKFIPDLAAFERAWLADSEAFAVFAPTDFEKLSATLKTSMRIASTDPRRIVVEKIPAASGIEPAPAETRAAP